MSILQENIIKLGNRINGLIKEERLLEKYDFSEEAFDLLKENQVSKNECLEEYYKMCMCQKDIEKFEREGNKR